MKIKNNELELLLMGFDQISKLRTGFRVGYAIAKSRRKVESAIKDIQKARMSIIEAHCIMENEKPKVVNDEYVFQDGLKEKVLKELTNLSEMEVDVELHSLPITEYENIPEITPSIIYLLDKMIAS